MAISAMFMGLFVTVATFAASLFFLDLGLTACFVMAFAFGSFTATAVVLVSVLIALRDLNDLPRSDQLKKTSS